MSLPGVGVWEVPKFFVLIVSIDKFVLIGCARAFLESFIDFNGQHWWKYRNELPISSSKWTRLRKQKWLYYSNPLPEEETQPQPTDAVLGGKEVQPCPYDAVLGGKTLI